MILEEKSDEERENFTDVEQFATNSTSFCLIRLDLIPKLRLKLEESKDAKYIQIPRYDRFVEKSRRERRFGITHQP
jgi:hypothetical protein